MSDFKRKNPSLGMNVPSDVLYRIIRHLNHLQRREGIRVDSDAIVQRIALYRKKKSETSQHVAKVLTSIEAGLVSDGEDYWHLPVVSPFHTKTGRDTPLGAALNYIGKEYWPKLLQPPDGFAYVLLDYQQQEPVIAAHLAGCDTLLTWYEQGDIYERLCQLSTGLPLTRIQAKQLLISVLYGIGKAKLAIKLNVSELQVSQWLKDIEKVIEPIKRFLDKTGKEIQQAQTVRSLDWRYSVNVTDSFNSLRNWKVQAMGADIMRRACLGFDAAQIRLLLTNHDSFLIKLPEANLETEIERADQVLGYASAAVLGNQTLKTKVEMIIPSRKTL
ncbi:DNA polymerase [Vibrio sp. PNB22_3_1]